jgi:hypothetical protein
MSGTDVRKIGSEIVSVVAGVGGALRHQLRPTHSSADGRGESEGRWLVVTIDRSSDEVAPGGQLPQPLADLGDSIEVQLRQAPGGRGSELAARSREPVPTGVGAAAATVKGDDPRQAIRTALRQSKQLVEVGEVMRLDPAPHGKRSATPGGKLVELVASRSGGEGVL